MTIPKQRQRNSAKLSEEGKIVARESLYFQALSQQQWAEKIFVSISTVKRFLKGDKIDRDYFEKICYSLNLNPDELIAPPNNQQNSAATPVPIPPERSPAQHSGTSPQKFMLTATFSSNKLAEIEIALAHLEKLLRDNCTITLVPEGNYLAVSGTFSEDKKPEVEVTLMHLEKLLLEHSISYR
jgi:DNA-binding Xre family transcriptional regulator